MMRKLLLLLALAAPQLAFAALGVEAVGAGSGTVSDRTVAFTVTSANLLMVAVTFGDGTPGTPTVTWNGTGMTFITGSDIDDTNPWSGVRWFRLFSPAAGTFNVVADTDGFQQSAVHIISFIDADIAGTPLGTPSTATNTTANPSLTVVDSANGNIVVAAIANDNESGASEPTGGQGFTEIGDFEDVGGDTDHNSIYKTASGANTVMSLTNSASGNGWAFSGVAVKGIGGGQSNAPRAMHYKKLMSQ